MSRSIQLLLCAACIAIAAGPAVPDGTPVGVVVESPLEGTSAEQAGLLPGDVLLRWHRAASPPANPEPASGEIGHPFDLWDVEVEQAPRGEVTLSGLREGEPFAFVMPPHRWPLELRPELREEDLEPYAEGLRLAESEDAADLERAVAVWHSLAERWRVDDPQLAAWILWRVAEVKLEHGLGEDRGRASFEAAVAVVEGLDQRIWVAEMSRRRASVLDKKSLFEEAEELFQSALGLWKEVKPGSLGVAMSLQGSGYLAWRRGDLPTAQALLEEALRRREAIAPGSLAVAETLNGLGLAAWNRGDLDASGQLHRRALAIREQLAPRSEEVAASLNNLGIIAYLLGDLPSAEELYRRSLEIKRQANAVSGSVAKSLNNLAIIAFRRGDLIAAENMWQQCLSLLEGQHDEMEVARVLQNMGSSAIEREDPTAAVGFYRRALKIREALSPGSLDAARTLGNLGWAEYQRGDLASAQALLEHALEIHERLAPGSLELAWQLDNLSSVHRDGTELALAREFQARALVIRRHVAPRSLDVGESLYELGEILRLQGDLDAAQSAFKEALEIRQELSPDSTQEAETLYGLAELARTRGRATAEVLCLHLRALEALETQDDRVGGSVAGRGGFLAQYGGMYRDTMELLIRDEQTAEAYHVLERSRARGLLAILAERDLLFTKELPEAIQQERNAANAEYDRVLQRLGAWTSSGEEAAEEKEALRRELTNARLGQERVEAKIRAAAPRLAELRRPSVLTLRQAQAALDPGTLVLAYSIGEAASFLFLVGRDPASFSALTLETDDEALRGLVERFRDSWKPGRDEGAWIRSQAEALSRILLRPAAARIAAAERLVVVPDGPLHYLPFAALQDPSSGDRFAYLIEAKPVSVVASITLLAQLKADRGGRSETRLAAFADPSYPALESEEAAGEPVLRHAVRDGFRLPALPGSRSEAEALGTLFPETSRLYLGEEATEAAAKGLGEDVAIVHFACHGLVDDRLPLNSALALSIPEAWQEGTDNGLLQAWEIFEQVRLKADLVTLSACDTALGKESAGEGLLGLTRAFQFAGARSVLASLWSVSDRSTAELMRRFYGHLRSGMPKNEALRQAQIELLAGPVMVDEGGSSEERDFTHPFHWAPFQLIGDWL